MTAKFCVKCGKPCDRKGIICVACIRLARPKPGQPVLRTKHQQALARARVRYALHMRRLERFPCEICDESDSDAHHPDYSKPLEVVWLCRKHHLALHKKNHNIVLDMSKA